MVERRGPDDHWRPRVDRVDGMRHLVRVRVRVGVGVGVRVRVRVGVRVRVRVRRSG